MIIWRLHRKVAFILDYVVNKGIRLSNKVLLCKIGKGDIRYESLRLAANVEVYLRRDRCCRIGSDDVNRKRKYIYFCSNEIDCSAFF
jgi:hypothetical protein